MQDLVAGQIDMMISDPVTALPQARAGNIKIYGVPPTPGCPPRPMSRPSMRPDCPATTLRCGTAFWMPKGTPKPIIEQVSAAAAWTPWPIPAARAKLADLGQDIYPRERQTPEALGALQKADIEKWWPIIKAGNIKVE